MAVGKREVDANLRCAWGILLVVLCLLVSLSLFSYDWKDISWLHAPPNTPAGNLIGLVGAWLSYSLFTAFGVGAYLVPFLCLVFGAILIVNREEKAWPRIVWCAVLMLALVSLFELDSMAWMSTCRRLNILPDTGGIFGRLLMRSLLVKWLSPVGAGIVVGSILLIALVMLVEMENIIRGWQRGLAFLRVVAERVQAYRKAQAERRELAEKEKRDSRRPLDIADRKWRKPFHAPGDEKADEPVEEEEPPKGIRPVEIPHVVIKTSPPAARPEPKPKEPPAAEKPVRRSGSGYQIPPLSLLQIPAPSKDRGIKADTATTAKILVETLAEFGMETQVTNVEEGPVVTRYELLPAPGIRVERISALSNNLALSLKATSVRVQAPIPGKGVVGIEVPNTTANIVYLREVLEGKAWKSSKIKLPLALGKDVGGSDLVADLAAMPHLLLAGATGSGKTVCMNSILTGLLMARTPEQLRLLLVDPKIVEFAAYCNLPHLVVPVITNPKKVAIGLRWAINEMEQRYKLFAKARVRNIEGYNTREIVTQKELFGDRPAGEEPAEGPPARLPYIVVVIDELADLMLADQAEIENCVARLAQLSRAVGIHMILSTQRPSVNVITGTIKANFPARIAFQVAQKVDSRTILDTIGADKLLGRGDMLFLPPGTSKLVRAQGAIVGDDEIHAITDFIRGQAAPVYEVEIQEKIEKPDSKLDDSVDDEIVSQALAIIRETRRASTSSLQRRLRIGYTRAARIMDILEERGVLGPPKGAEPREILIDLDGEIPDNAGQQEGQ